MHGALMSKISGKKSQNSNDNKPVEYVPGAYTASPEPDSNSTLDPTWQQGKYRWYTVQWSWSAGLCCAARCRWARRKHCVSCLHVCGPQRVVRSPFFVRVCFVCCIARCTKKRRKFSFFRVLGDVLSYFEQEYSVKH